ncbi:hypothetical protein GCM10022276_15160 [Sphingomonas limnosediminicola]|jgi:hypothetical protein|uniref:Uncharacterized protein n=1 Tax=Sphingomonas limnosediminicola TaxID=940133 RepID=A0ABP7LBB7_9SPHN
MTKLIITLAAAASATGGLVALPAPALAQASSNVAEIVVYGNDPCPRSTDDQVVVCARRPEADRFRIPEKLRPSGTRQQTEAWANRSKALETVGSTGINSCSPVGPGGYTGCLTRVIRDAREQNQQKSPDTTPPEQ